MPRIIPVHVRVQSQANQHDGRRWSGANILDILVSRSASVGSSVDGIHGVKSSLHDDVIKWKHFPRYWPFVRGIHRSPVNSQHKGQ